MSNFFNLDNATVVTGVTSTGQFLVTDINDVKVGWQLFTFSDSTPNIDFVSMIDTSIEIEGATLISSGTSYGGGLALTINNSARCTPLFRLDTLESPDLAIYDPVVVEGLISTGTYFAIKVNNVAYGVPIYEFTDQYLTPGVAPSAVDITTLLAAPTNDLSVESPSTFASSKIDTYSEVMDRLKRNFGYPMMEVELCDEHFIDFIDQAVELYTKYSGMTEEFLAFDSDSYPVGRGIHIPTVLANIHESYQGTDETLHREFIDPGSGEYRKCSGVFSLDTAEHTGTDALFTLEYIYAQQVYYSYMLGSYGFDLVTWETLKQFLDLRKKVFSAVPRFIFDVPTQRLRLIPEPTRKRGFIGIIGLYLEQPVKDVLRERWVQHYAFALSKIAVGNIRTKYTGMTMFGGAQINGTDLLSQGLEEKKALESEILENYGADMTPPLFFIG